MSQTISEEIAKYLCSETIDSIDAPAVLRTKQIITYHIGLACRAIQVAQPDAIQAVVIAQELSENCGSSTLIGHSESATLVDAAFANCTMMRALGRDDVIFPAGIHPGLMTLPVALGIGERTAASGAELITAIVCGYEVLGKFGQFSWAFDTPRRPTMPFGPFGSIATGTKLLGLSREQTVVALAYAAHTAMGLAENDLGPVTHYYSLVCRNAIIGAYASRAGAWGSPTVLEGKYGFIDVFLGSAGISEDELIDSLGADYVVMESREKRYPGTALNQIPIELIRSLVHEQDLRAADVERIKFVFPLEREKFSAGHELGPFTSSAIAGSSFAFQCAMLLLDGEQDVARYDDYANAEIQSIVDKITVEFVPDKNIRYTRIELTRKNGEKHVVEGDDFKFSPGPTRLVLERDCAGVVPEDKITRLVDILDNLEDVDDVSELMSCLVP